jgi:hypothetical protein
MNRLLITALLASVAVAPAYAGKKDGGGDLVDRAERAAEKYDSRIDRLENRLEDAGDEERQRIENAIESITEKYEAKWGLPEEPPPPPPEEPEPTVLFQDNFNRDGDGLPPPGNGWQENHDARVQCINCFATHPLLDANGAPVLNPDGTPVMVPGAGVLGLQQTEAVSNHPIPAVATHSTGLEGTNYDFFTLSYDYATTVSSTNSKLTASWSADGITWTDLATHTIEGGDLAIWPNTSHASFTFDNNDFAGLYISFKAEGDPWVYVDNVSLTGSYTPTTFVGY